MESVRIVIPPEKLAAALSKAFTKPLLSKLQKENDKSAQNFPGAASVDKPIKEVS